MRGASIDQNTIRVLSNVLFFLQINITEDGVAANFTRFGIKSGYYLCYSKVQKDTPACLAHP